MRSGTLYRTQSASENSPFQAIRSSQILLFVKFNAKVLFRELREGSLNEIISKVCDTTWGVESGVRWTTIPSQLELGEAHCPLERTGVIPGNPTSVVSTDTIVTSMEVEEI